jgi:predicted extracellular nuclease
MKKILLSISIFTTAIAGFSQAPCSDLFFSEYIEGSSQNKALEVYNPTPNPIDLSNYHIYRYVNGGTTPGDTLYMTGMLASGSTYNIVDPDTAVHAVALLSVADTLHTVTFFNGNDPLYLFNGTTLIDVIGEANGSDIGAAGWVVGTGSTVNHTLRRKPTVFVGTTNWTVGITQWDSFAQNDFTNFGSHTMNSCATAGVNDEQAIEISLYPNPTSGYLNISSEADNYAIQIIELTGKVAITRNNLSQNSTIDLSALSNGIYIVKINAGSTQLTKKIIVRK